MLPASTVSLLTQLAKLAGSMGESVEGNCYTYDRTTTAAPELITKQANLSRFSQQHQRVLEIGFNAGHSAALFLTANPQLRLTCLDIGEHKYVQPCYQLLRDQFGDRIELIIASSLDLTKVLDQSYYKVFDGCHVDGNHNHPWYIYDTISCLRYLADSAEFIMDDTNMAPIARWVKFLQTSILFQPASGYQATQLYQHEILRFVRPRVVVATVIVGQEYSDTVAPATQSLVEYCNYWGLELVQVRDNLDSQRPIAWSKIKLLQQLAVRSESPEVLVWLDADIVITNQQHSLDERMLFLTATKDFLIGRDGGWPINTGSFLMHNTTEARAFLEQIYQQTQYIDHDCGEQAAMAQLIKADSSRIMILSAKHTTLINAYVHYADWPNEALHKPQAGLWLKHFAGVRGQTLIDGINQAVTEAKAANYKGLNPANLTTLVEIVESLW